MSKSKLLKAILFITAFALTTTQAAYCEKVEWNIIAGPEGSFGYATSTILSKILTDNIPGFTAYSRSGGTIKAIRQMADSDLMMSYGTTASIEEAYLNHGPFREFPLTGPKPQIGLPIFTMTFFMAVKNDTNINTMDDLAGKRVTITTPSYGIYTPAYEVLKAIGLLDKVQLKDVSFADYSGSVVSGNVDAAMLYVVADSTTSAAIKDFEARVDFKVLTFSESQKKIIDNLPGINFRKAKNIFSHLKNENIEGWNFYNGWFFSQKASSHLVYKIMKIAYDRRKSLADSIVGFGPWSDNPNEILQDALKICRDVEIHPGAAKFFKELKLIK
jgi:TRAP transporter TAXI family solute receptor